MSKSKNDKEAKVILDEFDQLRMEATSEFDFSKHLATLDDLPDLGEIEIYDYDADLTTSSALAMEVLESLVELYMGDLPNLMNHPYIKNKMREDATVYAEAIFLSKMSRKSLLSQLKIIDHGDSSSRAYEVVNQTIAQIRENSKFLSTQRTELEKYWKELRNDMGYDEIGPSETTVSENNDPVMDNRKLNDLIKNALMKKSK